MRMPEAGRANPSGDVEEVRPPNQQNYSRTGTLGGQGSSCEAVAEGMREGDLRRSASKQHPSHCDGNGGACDKDLFANLLDGGAALRSKGA